MLRWFLVFSNLAICLLLASLVIREPHGGDARQTILVGGIIATCALNAFYLAMAMGSKLPSRVSRFWRLADLWLAAKEEELRRRGKSDQQKSN